MDLKLSPKYEAFRTEVLAFLHTYRSEYRAAIGGERRRADINAWQKLLIQKGDAARTVPANTAAMAASRTF